MSLVDNIANIKHRIQDTACQYHRDPAKITLLAISKTQPASIIREAFNAGIKQFGENYWQEAQAKQAQLRDLPIIWHFTGPIQSNKAADIAQSFLWVHSLDRLKIATLLSAHRPEHLPPLNVCIQVNLDKEASKSGVRFEDLSEIAQQVNKLPHLTLRGLMAIPEPVEDHERQYQSLLRLTHLRDKLNQTCNLSLDTLSMGMSDDMIPAIRAGSTMLRIGRSLFGERL